MSRCCCWLRLVYYNFLNWLRLITFGWCFLSRTIICIRFIHSLPTEFFEKVFLFWIGIVSLKSNDRVTCLFTFNTIICINMIGSFFIFGSELEEDHYKETLGNEVCVSCSNPSNKPGSLFVIYYQDWFFCKKSVLISIEKIVEYNDWQIVKRKAQTMQGHCSIVNLMAHSVVNKKFSDKKHWYKQKSAWNKLFNTNWKPQS